MNWIRGKQNGTKASANTVNPLARSDELVVEEIAEEVLIYDQRTDQAHCLSTAPARVWRACDGTTSAEQLGVELELDAATVARALEELEACGLLETGAKAGVTRREAATRFAKLGAVGAAAPLIWSIVGPISEAAATVTPAFCAISIDQDCGEACAHNANKHCCCCCHNGNDNPCGRPPPASNCCYPTALCLAQGFNCTPANVCP